MGNKIYDGNLSDKMSDEKILTAIEWLAEQTGLFLWRYA